MTEQIEAVLHYWFGPLDDTGMPEQDRNALWFKSSEATDQAIAQDFGDRVEQALAGELASWSQNDRGVVALVILLDQFTRNIYRGTAKAFTGDTGALALAQHAIATGHFQRMPAIHQVFLFMPLEHCEDLDTQEECVALFTELAAVTGQPLIASFCRYAQAHRDVIARFGRFPHRNPLLGRPSSAEEQSYLQSHGGF
jgi:uncharacterized protein (DUF924 family)